MANALSSAFKKLIYLPNGEFSMTRILMILTIGQALITGLIGISCAIFTTIKIPTDVYDFSIKLAGGAIGQYGITKLKNSYDQRSENIDKNIPKV